MFRSARTLLVFVVFVLCTAGVGVGVASLPNPPAAHATTTPAVTAPPAAVAPTAPVVDPATGYALTATDRGFLAELLGPDTDVTPAAAAGLVLAGQRVCEGYTAGVPAPLMAATVAADQGLTPAEAVAFVALADATYCGSTV